VNLVRDMSETMFVVGCLAAVGLVLALKPDLITKSLEKISKRETKDLKRLHQPVNLLQV
jgi:hypothetical protein